jgi:hypothetical protein
MDVSYHRTPDGCEDVEWQGRIYRRFPNHENRHRRVYFMSTTAPRTYLHRDIWEHTHGRKIRKGWHIHHVDHDPDNNSPDNLAAISPSKHSAHHSRHRERFERSCDRCGRVYSAGMRWGRWCSSSCKEAQRRKDGVAYIKPRKGAFLEQRICNECGAEYIAKRPWATFCGPECRGKHGRARRRGSKDD